MVFDVTLVCTLMMTYQASKQEDRFHCWPGSPQWLTMPGFTDDTVIPQSVALLWSAYDVMIYTWTYIILHTAASFTHNTTHRHTDRPTQALAHGRTHTHRRTHTHTHTNNKQTHTTHQTHTTEHNTHSTTQQIHTQHKINIHTTQHTHCTVLNFHKTWTHHSHSLLADCLGPKLLPCEQPGMILGQFSCLPQWPSYKAVVPSKSGSVQGDWPRQWTAYVLNV